MVADSTPTDTPIRSPTPKGLNMSSLLSKVNLLRCRPYIYPFLLFLRRDLQVQVQAHLTALSVSAPKIVLQLQVPFLDHFLSLFWAPI